MNARRMTPLLLVLVACSKETPTTKDPSAPSASSTAAPAALVLARDNEVTVGRSYQVGDVAVSVRRIAMANTVDDQGRENHELRMELSIEHAGRSTELELAGERPGEAAGLIFRANALGFQWGKTPPTATLRVDRK